VKILGTVEQIRHTAYLDSGCGELEIGKLTSAIVQLSVRGVGGGRWPREEVGQ
jgi:hypothetical protein